MIRPRLTLLLPLAAVLIAGCSGFSDNNAVARFEQSELSTGELTELMNALGPPNTEADVTNAAAARETITLWVQIEAITQRLEQDGIVIDDAAIDLATSQMSNGIPEFASLSDRMRDYLINGQAAFTAFNDVAPPSDAELREVYDRGPLGSGVTCVAHILVETKQEADDVRAELDAGAPFAELAADRSIDPGSAPIGGVLPCTPTDEFSSTFVAPFAEAAVAAEIGAPTAPIESEFGFHIILVRPFDEAQAEIEQAVGPQDFALARGIEQADVYIDPRYGTIVNTTVVALS